MSEIEDRYLRNRLHNCKNPYQGGVKKVLCVCSAGLLRSPTAANVLHREYGFNTRAAGLVPDYALIPVDEVLLTWADEVICMNSDQRNELTLLTDKPIYSLNIPDSYDFMDAELQQTIIERYEEFVV